MEYLWLIAVPVTFLCVMAIAAHAAFMRSMMPPTITDTSELNTRAPEPASFAAQPRNPQEVLWNKGDPK